MDLTGRLTSKNDSFVNLLRGIITVLLLSLSKLSSNDAIISDTFEKCEVALKKWIVHENVIGGSVFGRRWKAQSSKEVLLECAPRELQV